MPGSLRCKDQSLTEVCHSQVLRDAVRLCIERRWRLPLWLQASAAAQLPSVIALWQALYQAEPAGAPLRGFCLGEPPQGTAIDWTALQGQARQLVLGRECDILLVNGHDGIDWDLVAASMGTVKQGGLWLLLSPAGFPYTANPLAKKVLSWPTDATSHQGEFQTFVAQTLTEQPLWQIYQHDDELVVKPTLAWQHQIAHALPSEVQFSVVAQWPTDTAPTVTDDQQQALDAINKVLTGHRRRPLVLTAHRGRGKSTVLGLAAAAHYLKSQKRIVITAPDPTAATVAMRTAAEYASAAALEFVPIDRLLAEQPRCDLLLVDEAAAIPLPQLQQLNSSYSRVVYATTEHGYEGTGRGFQLRFLQYLQLHNPGWHLLHLQRAIRFADGDPLEQLCFASFLLGPLPSLILSNLEHGAVAHQWISQQTLGQEPALLQQVFALLALAHYQTRVRDLWALLDDPSQRLAVQKIGDTVIGVMVISTEGGFPAELAAAVAAGARRVQGHLLAQSLAYHLLLPELAQHTWWRVQRIVINPKAQHQGLGRRFLSWLEEQATAAGTSLGTSFGAQADLVHFWQTQGYLPVRLGLQLDQASNEHPLLMLKPSPQVPESLLQQLQDEMGQQLYLHRLQLKRFATSLLRQWIRPLPHTLGTGQKRMLWAFAHDQRPLAEVHALLPYWLDLVYWQLDSKDAEVLIEWLWLERRFSPEQQQALIALSRICIQMTYINI